MEMWPHMVIVKAQAWFWTERWQRMEREADEEYATGRYRTHDSTEEFIAELEVRGPVEHVPARPVDDGA